MQTVVFDYSMNTALVYVCSGISASYRCHRDISISSISSLRFTHSKHALGWGGGGGGIKRHRDAECDRERGRVKEGGERGAPGFPALTL